MKVFPEMCRVLYIW